MSEKTILANDTLSGKEGFLWAKIGNDVVEVAEVRNITARIDLNIADFNALGDRATQHKVTGWNGTGSFTYYFLTSRWSDMIINYTNTGKLPYFELTFKNEDPNSRVGRNRVRIGRVLLNGADIAKLDVDADFLDASSDFTFSTVAKLEGFKDYQTIAD